MIICTGRCEIPPKKVSIKDICSDSGVQLYADCLLTATTAFDPLYLFIMLFVVNFQPRYLSETAAEFLMKFINALLEYFTGPFCLLAKLITLRKQTAIGSVTTGLKRYVVWPKCHKTFDIEHFDLEQPGRIIEQVRCDHKEFPLRNISTCGQSLFKRSSGNRAIHIKVLAYDSLKHTLERFFGRPNFVRSINLWRQRSHRGNVLYDI